MPHTGVRMRFAGFRGGVILVHLVWLSGVLHVEKVADLHVRWIFALTIELFHSFFNRSIGNTKSAVQGCEFLLSRKFI